MDALSSSPAVVLPSLKVKPRLRGSSHFIAFFFAVVAGAALVALTPLRGTARIGAEVYAVGLALMLGVSGFYHRPMWSPAVRRIFKKIDHAAIFVQIAGTYTAFWTLTPPNLRSPVLLAVMWVSAIAGAATFVVFTDVHRGIRAATYVGLGLSTLPLAVTLPAVIGTTACAVLIASSALYVAGAVVYARRWPDPNPQVFGYHEVFHVMVVIAAAAQFAVIAWKHAVG